MFEPRSWKRPMLPRAHTDAHRQATWLELFFDLSFVVAVAQAAVQLEHAYAAGHVAQGLIGFAVVFAAIWWAWMAFTWFSNVFDNDDLAYRLLMFVMIAGSLGLAAGVPQIAHLDFRIGVLSYVVMRLAYVAQWCRVYYTCDETWRPVARRMIVLTTINQLGWVLFLWVPQDWKLTVFAIWFAADIATPWLARWDARMGGHRHHIVERYGLFTIIVLGESVAAATVAISHAIDAGAAILPLLTLAGGGLGIVLSLWWIYFEFTSGRAPDGSRRAQYRWSYLHYFVFASLAAVGAGLALIATWLEDPAQVTLPATGLALAVGGPVAVYLAALVAIEFLAEGTLRGSEGMLFIAAAAGMLAIPCAAPLVTVPGSILLLAILLAALVAVGTAVQHRSADIAGM